MTGTTLSLARPARTKPMSIDRGDRAYTVVVAALLGGAVLAIIYPLYFIVIASFSEPDAVNNGRVWVLPEGFTLDGYRRLLADPRVWRGVVNSLTYTSLATALSVALILTAGYALSRKELPWRNAITALFLVTLFFDGGMIPRYLVVKELGMLNTVWAMILPNAVAVWNLLIARTYFTSAIPVEVREAAYLDGASELKFFLRIALPLAKPLIAVMVLIHLVWNWNAFFDALIFLTDESKFPLQLVLRNILVQSEVSASGNLSSDLSSYAEQQRLGELIKYGMIVVSTVPLLLLSPFAQRYLSRGGVEGALKG
ncbi:putative aldouronate transport system permease protein [Kribbella antiqua]|uniref:Putative aldouronate transport system permease protein n=2 Tax=Kribbella antiqua TaxID=2512217 RepID=A0A4R2IJT0_9ACTN|nr:putative aldouronate transport system permease protein [Kribbella antiqua]